MKVSVSQNQLAHGLSIVSRAVNPRNTLPVLGNILVATDEGRLRLSGTNLDLGITCWISAKISEEGSITVPVRTFVDLVSTLPNDTVNMTLNAKTQTLTVRCGTNMTDIKGIDAQEFPPVPVPDLNAGIRINAGEFKEMIQQVAFAASSDEARPVLHGVSVSVTNNEINLAATDGYRISVRKANISVPLDVPLNAIIPARALSEVARVASDQDETVTMVIPQGRNQVIFHLKDIEVASLLIEGNFPDFRAIIPRTLKTHTILTTSSFLKACRQAEIIAREGNNVIKLNIQPGGDKPGEVEISAQYEQTGLSEVKIDASVDGPGLLVAFNVRFLREVLDVIRTPNVILETNQNNTPALVRPVGDENFMHVIMPMHLG
jgi:DNA polymerase-3 subunit beta